MCGLVGIFAQNDKIISPDGVKAFRYLLHLDVLRGDHSTGICGVKDGVASVLKHVGPPEKTKTFVGNSIFNEHGFANGHSLLLGHNRYATKGKVDVANAHPFTTQNGKVVGAHNGTVNARALGRIDKDNPFGTDSEFIYNSISERGLKETIKHLHGGTYALTWYDTEEKSFNILRNSERPLWLAKSGDAYIYASEKWMIEMAASRAGIQIEDPTSVPINRHYKYVLGETGHTSEEVKPDVQVYSFRNYHYVNDTQEEEAQDYSEEWDRLTSQGCCNCISPVEYKDSNKVLWVDSHTFFCGECVENNVPQSYGIQVGAY